jgi:hypothetical protein
MLYIDAAGEVHCLVSDEQALVLLENGIAKVNERNGWKAKRHPAAERLAYLLQLETWTNPYGVEIHHHAEMGDIEWQEACAGFVLEHGPALIEQSQEKAK